LGRLIRGRWPNGKKNLTPRGGRTEEWIIRVRRFIQVAHSEGMVEPPQKGGLMREGAQGGSRVGKVYKRIKRIIKKAGVIGGEKNLQRRIWGSLTRELRGDVLPKRERKRRGKTSTV